MKHPNNQVVYDALIRLIYNSLTDGVIARHSFYGSMTSILASLACKDNWSKKAPGKRSNLEENEGKKGTIRAFKEKGN